MRRDFPVKATPQRREILRALAATTSHPDVEDIHNQVKRRIPSLALDTVYRNLRMLEQAGIINRVAAHKNRARFDAKTTAHHHFLCIECERIFDCSSAVNALGHAPPDVLACGRVDNVVIEWHGLCKKCLKKHKRGKEAE